MTPQTVSVFIQVVWFGSAFGLRILLDRRTTQTTGINPISGRIGSPEWIGGVTFVAALIAGFISPLRNLGRETTWSLLSSFGLALAAAGVIATFIAQGAMGKSWRIGVDKSERTQPATEGLFSVVRNPIFTAMMLTSFGPDLSCAYRAIDHCCTSTGLFDRTTSTQSRRALSHQNPPTHVPHLRG
jgi:protein-S-isoprenylcysteine O-methyltransferase Ste14